MTPIVMSDVIALARALRAAPMVQRKALIATIFSEACRGKAFAKEHGKTHPAHGNGSVMAASAGHPQVAEPWLNDREYCLCLRDIFEVLAER